MPLTTFCFCGILFYIIDGLGVPMLLCYKVPVPTLVLYHKNVDDTGIFSYQCLKSAAKQYSALVINSPLWQGGLNHSPTTFDLQLLLRAETEVTKIVIFLDGQRCTLWQNSWKLTEWNWQKKIPSWFENILKLSWKSHLKGWPTALAPCRQLWSLIHWFCSGYWRQLHVPGILPGQPDIFQR